MTRVLLVDDDPAIRDLVATFLGDEGFDVTTAELAETALTALARSLADVLILDGRLPGMTGWECLDVLRANDRTARLPILILTAAVDDVHKLARLPADCTAYLIKPFDLDDLLAAIHGVIETCKREAVMV